MGWAYVELPFWKKKKKSKIFHESKKREQEKKEKTKVTLNCILAVPETKVKLFASNDEMEKNEQKKGLIRGD